MEVNVHVLNAFTKDGKGGNLAGVVIDPDRLSRSSKQTIAKKVGFSETAFIGGSSKADFKLQFFTPNGEVDVCGHATLASFHLLRVMNRVSVGTYQVETKKDVLKVQIDEDGGISLFQMLPRFFDVLPHEEIAASLGLQPEDLDLHLPIQIVSTGLRDILIPIKKLDTLKRIQPNFADITRISQANDVIGYHLFSLETESQEGTAHCRNFAPLYGIPEESATGTSNGALCSYLFTYNALSKNNPRFLFEQGYTMNEPSSILVELGTDSTDTITSVKVGGYVVYKEQRVITISC